MAEKFIDIEKIIGEKNPRVLKWMPRFILRYLKRILHEDEVNKAISETKDIYGYDFCVEIINRFQIKVALEGTENIPKTGGAIFTCNHPLGGFDARYFMYCEDVDLCLRLRLQGWQLVRAAAQVQHQGSRASRRAWQPLAWHIHSLLRLWASPVFWRARTLSPLPLAPAPAAPAPATAPPPAAP